MELEKNIAEELLTNFSTALGEVECSLRPVLTAVNNLCDSAQNDELDAMTRARLHITICYAANALFCMYLRTQGMDPLEHPVMDEVTRVQEAFMRMRKVEAGLEGGVEKPADRDRRKHIQNAKKSEAKLSSVIYPEESELLRALYNMKKGKEALKNNNDELESGISEPEDEARLAHLRTTKADIVDLQQLAKKKERKEKRKREEKLSKAIKKKRTGKKSRKGR